MLTPLFRCIYNTECEFGRRITSVSMAELLQLPLDVAAICTSLSSCLPVKGSPFSVYAVATNHTLVHIFFEVFLAFFHSCTWISVRVAKEVERKQV